MFPRYAHEIRLIGTVSQCALAVLGIFQVSFCFMKMICKRATLYSLATAALGFGILLGSGVPASASTLQAQPGVSSSVSSAPTVFKPNACVVRAGWTPMYKIINGRKYQLYGEIRPPQKCPVGLWRIPGTYSGGYYV